MLCFFNKYMGNEINQRFMSVISFIPCYYLNEKNIVRQILKLLAAWPWFVCRIYVLGFLWASSCSNNAKSWTATPNWYISSNICKQLRKNLIADKWNDLPKLKKRDVWNTIESFHDFSGIPITHPQRNTLNTPPKKKDRVSLIRPQPLKIPDSPFLMAIA